MMSSRFSDRVTRDKRPINKDKCETTKSSISLPGHKIVGNVRDTGRLELSERAMTVGDLKKRYELRDVVKQVTMNINNNNVSSSSESSNSTPVNRR